MNFDIDKQTLNDLAIFQNNNSRQSIYNLFSHTNTIGGNEVLQDMFNKPLTDPVHIKESDLPKKIQEFRSIISNIFRPKEFVWLKQLIEKPNRNAMDIAKADHFFRQLAYERMKILLNVAYQLNVYQSVSLAVRPLVLHSL